MTSVIRKYIQNALHTSEIWKYLHKVECMKELINFGSPDSQRLSEKEISIMLW